MAQETFMPQEPKSAGVYQSLFAADASVLQGLSDPAQRAMHEDLQRVEATLNALFQSDDMRIATGTTAERDAAAVRVHQGLKDAHTLALRAVNQEAVLFPEEQARMTQHVARLNTSSADPAFAELAKEASQQQADYKKETFVANPAAFLKHLSSQLALLEREKALLERRRHPTDQITPEIDQLKQTIAALEARYRKVDEMKLWQQQLEEARANAYFSPLRPASGFTLQSGLFQEKGLSKTAKEIKEAQESGQYTTKWLGRGLANEPRSWRQIGVAMTSYFINGIPIVDVLVNSALRAIGPYGVGAKLKLTYDEKTNRVGGLITPRFKIEGLAEAQGFAIDALTLLKKMHEAKPVMEYDLTEVINIVKKALPYEHPNYAENLVMEYVIEPFLKEAGVHPETTFKGITNDAVLNTMRMKVLKQHYHYSDAQAQETARKAQQGTQAAAPAYTAFNSIPVKTSRTPAAPEGMSSKAARRPSDDNGPTPTSSSSPRPGAT